MHQMLPSRVSPTRAMQQRPPSAELILEALGWGAAYILIVGWSLT